MVGSTTMFISSLNHRFLSLLYAIKSALAYTSDQVRVQSKDMNILFSIANSYNEYISVIVEGIQSCHSLRVRTTNDRLDCVSCPT